VKRAALWIVGLLLALGIATYVAGEQTEVVVLRSFDADGKAHDTKVWAVDHDGAVWVRVANPRRGWFTRLLAQPRAELVRNGATQAVVAEPNEQPEVRAAVDAAFRAKYGVVDWWYGVLLRRDPVPVRLQPKPAPRAMRSPTEIASANA
jgi:hypothetical protein